MCGVNNRGIVLVYRKDITVDQEKILKSATAWQYRQKQTTESLGSIADGLLKSQQRVFKKNTQVVDAWDSMVPPNLAVHSRLAKISGGNIYIEVEPGVYMHEMKLISSELLESIQGRCPYAGIKKIVLSPLRKNEYLESTDND